MICHFKLSAIVSFGVLVLENMETEMGQSSSLQRRLNLLFAIRGVGETQVVDAVLLGKMGSVQQFK